MNNIIPAPLIKDCSGNIGITKMEITYTQEPDTNSRRDEYQYLTISTENTVCDYEDVLNGEEGHYYIIKTDKWAVNDANKLTKIFNDFHSRLMLGLEELQKKHKEQHETDNEEKEADD